MTEYAENPQESTKKATRTRKRIWQGHRTQGL